MTGRSAIVTGGATGIGEAIVRALCEDGFNVCICYNKSGDKASALSLELLNKGYSVHIVRGDISDPDEAKRIFESASDHFGKILYLVNNAGIAEQRLFSDIYYDNWRKMLAVNLDGAYNMCRAVLPAMIHEKHGSIVNISSMWGQVGASCEVHYSASKAGLIGLTKALAKEVGPSGIRVNCVAPGCVNTAMMSQFSEEEINDICEDIPLGRIAAPYEIANAVSFLISDKASYITGQVLGVNGGMVV